MSASRGPAAIVVDVNNRQVLRKQRNQTFVNDFVRTRPSSKAVDPQLEIRVQIDEEVMYDHESEYALNRVDDKPLPPSVSEPGTFVHVVYLRI
jgi:hypothetical protein